MNVNTDSNITSTSTKTSAKRGRPAKALKLILNKSFTIKDLQTLNPDIKFVTIRAAVLRGLSNGKYTKLPRNVQTGKKGKPANIFINTKVYKANLANLAKTKTVATVTAEVVTEPVVAWSDFKKSTKNPWLWTVKGLFYFHNEEHQES